MREVARLKRASMSGAPPEGRDPLREVFGLICLHQAL